MTTATVEPQPKSFDPTALLAEAMALHQAGRLADAERLCNQILAFDPKRCDCLNLLGVILRQREKPAQAVAQIDLSLARNPNNAATWNNRGTAFYELGRFDDAIPSYDRAPRPDFAVTHNNEALYQLLIGDLRRGWGEREWRWRTKELGQGRGDFPQPLRARGEKIASRTVLIHAEQGFVDIIQACRCVSLVADRGARVTVLGIRRCGCFGRTPRARGTLCLRAFAPRCAIKVLRGRPRQPVRTRFSINRLQRLEA